MRIPNVSMPDPPQHPGTMRGTDAARAVPVAASMLSPHARAGGRTVGVESRGVAYRGFLRPISGPFTLELVPKFGCLTPFNY